MALNKGIWDPKLRGTNIKGTNLKSLTLTLLETDMETTKGTYKDYSPSKRGLYGFPC